MQALNYRIGDQTEVSDDLELILESTRTCALMLFLGSLCRRQLPRIIYYTAKPLQKPSITNHRYSTMKEVIVSKGTIVKIIESPIPEPGPDDVVTKVVVSGSSKPPPSIRLYKCI